MSFPIPLPTNDIIDLCVQNNYKRSIELGKPKTNIRKVMPSIVDESANFSMEENYQGYIVGDIVTYTNVKCKELMGHRAKITKVVEHGKYEIMFLTGKGIHLTKPKVVVYQELALPSYKNLLK